jgi:hypothetical protein
MKRTAMFFVSLMMVVMVSAQSSYDFMFNNVAVSNTTTKTNVKSTPTRSISVDALAQATARRQNATRRNTTMTATAQTAPQTVQYTETQQQIVDMASANQKVVMMGEVTNVYMNGWDLILTVRTPGLYGGKHDYALQGYNSNIEIHRGDKIYFAATYTGTSIPTIAASEFLDYTGIQRYMTETADMYYGGNYGLMLSSNGQMSKYQKALMNITSTALTVATLVQVVKSIF